jgi:hypothetical protein
LSRARRWNGSFNHAKNARRCYLDRFVCGSHANLLDALRSAAVFNVIVVNPSRPTGALLFTPRLA